jgi:hypothetical protein
MFTNSVLFSAAGISFTLVRCFLGAALILGGLTTVLFVVLFKHSHGVVKRMSPEEAAQTVVYGVQRSWEFVPDPIVGVKAIGATGRTAEITFDIDSLRNAYRRGDRMSFWLSPILYTCWGLAFWLLFMAAMIWTDIPTGFQIMLTVLLFLFILLPWFMAWAAVNTNIDAGKAGTGASASFGGAAGTMSPRQGAPGDKRLR